MHDVSNGVGLLSALNALKSKLRMIAVTLVAGGIAGLVLLFVPNYYTAVRHSRPSKLKGFFHECPHWSTRPNCSPPLR